MNAMLFEYMRSLVPLTIRYSHLRVLIGILCDLWTLCVRRAFSGGILFRKALRDLSVVKFTHYLGFYT
jgi:hypothetical protein